MVSSLTGKRTLIIAGGNINYDFALSYLAKHSFDYRIAVDGGLQSMKDLGVMPTHIIGDFDTVPESVLLDYSVDDSIMIQRLSPQKDDTDTQSAMRWAFELESNEICILGGTGSRMDHTLANLHLLGMALERKISCYLLDANNRIYLVSEPVTLRKSEAYGKYISLFPYTEEVKGLTLTGFQYPLTNYHYRISNDFRIGVSNEISEDEGNIQFESGILMVIEAKD